MKLFKWIQILTPHEEYTILSLIEVFMKIRSRDLTSLFIFPGAMLGLVRQKALPIARAVNSVTGLQSNVGAAALEVQRRNYWGNRNEHRGRFKMRPNKHWNQDYKNARARKVLHLPNKPDFDFQRKLMADEVSHKEGFFVPYFAAPGLNHDTESWHVLKHFKLFLIFFPKDHSRWKTCVYEEKWTDYFCKPERGRTRFDYFYRSNFRRIFTKGVWVRNVSDVY